MIILHSSAHWSAAPVRKAFEQFNMSSQVGASRVFSLVFAKR